MRKPETSRVRLCAARTITEPAVPQDTDPILVAAVRASCKAALGSSFPCMWPACVCLDHVRIGAACAAIEAARPLIVAAERARIIAAVHGLENGDE